MDAAAALGKTLAGGTSSKGAEVVSAQVVDVTDEGTVNLMLNGALVLDVKCADSYKNRAAGDWVAVRIASGRPVVMWRPGDDPEDTTDAHIQELAEDAALDVQVVSAVTWGTADPAGSGWQEVATPYARKVNGKVQLYLKLGTETDTSPTAPTARPKSVSISPSDSGTWRGGRPDDYASSPTQGDWTGRGNRRGAWFYGSDIENACTGKTVATMTITITRKRGSGYNAKRPVHMYLHSHSSAPSGQLNLGDGPEDLISLSVGGKATVKLPASWRSALASGSAKGIAVYASGSRDYASFTGGTVKITFSA